LFKESLLHAINKTEIHSGFADDLDRELEVEAFSLQNNVGYVGLKKPLLKDGSSAIFKIENIKEFFETEGDVDLKLTIYATVQLSSSICENPGRISDLKKTESGLFILS